MAFVHQEANWGAHAGASAVKNRAMPSGVRAKTDVEKADVDCPTLEIAVELAEARDVTVVAVTTDRELRAALGEVLPQNGAVFADSAEQVLSRPVPNNCAVLIVEQTLSHSQFDRLKAHLKESAPALVSIMVGTGDNGSSLVARLSAGHIDRFMVKPFKLGPTRSALRSALQQHHSLRQCAKVERTAKSLPVDAKPLPIELAPGAPRTSASAPALKTKPSAQAHIAQREKPPAEVAQQPVVAESHNVALKGRLPLRSWSLAFAAAVAALAFTALGISLRTPELSKDKVIADHLAAALRAFEVGSYVDPPGLNAVHFYSAALELDPRSDPARRGLEAVGDRLIADSKELIVAGDLLRAQSMVDSVRRIQPKHRELAGVTASLLTAREAERATLQAAHSAKEISEAIPGAPARTSLAAATVVGSASARSEPKIKTSPQRGQLQVQVASAGVGMSGVSPSSRAPEKMQATNHTSSSTLASTTQPLSIQPSVQLNQPLPDLAEQAKQGRPETVLDEAAIIAAAKPASDPMNATEAPINVATSAVQAVATLVKYVEPVYPPKARAARTEGWIDVHFLVTSDGSVIKPRIENGSLDSAFRSAALAAVTQWKYSPAPTGATPNRPMIVRVRFQLADSKRT